MVGSAAAQDPPRARIGFSAAADHHVPEISIENGDEFDLHVIVVGMPGETAVPFDVQQFYWAILEGCCGSTMLVQDVQYAPGLQHEGNPFAGVISSAEVCLDEPFYHLATLRMRAAVPEPGVYQAGCIPLDLAIDCDGQEQPMMGMYVDIIVSGDQVPAADGSWSGVKALYRD